MLAKLGASWDWLQTQADRHAVNVTACKVGALRVSHSYIFTSYLVQVATWHG